MIKQEQFENQTAQAGSLENENTSAKTASTENQKVQANGVENKKSKSLGKKKQDPVIVNSNGDVVKFKKKESIKRADLIFYICLVIFPLAHFCIFYIGVNFDSIMMAFQRNNWVEEASRFIYKFDFSNFTEAMQIFFDPSKKYLGSLLRGLWYYLISFAVSTPLTFMFSYYVYKRCRGYNIFRIFLFLPSILSSMSLALIYQFFFDKGIESIFRTYFNFYIELGFLAGKMGFFMINLYSIFFGFGSGVLIYSDNMGAISPEVVESASLDGATGFREFIHITFPLIFGMWSIFFYTGIAVIFTGNQNLTSFFGMNAEDLAPQTTTLGYYMFVETQDQNNYTRLAAWGILISCILIPVTFVLRWLLAKFGPSTE